MGKKLTNQQFLERANSAHNGKYLYLEEYRGMNTKIKIGCPLHGIFEQTPHSHVDSKNGCPICGANQSHYKRRTPFTEFVVQAEQVHNHKYEYFGEYQNARTPIEIKCPVHGIFRQTPDKHLRGHDCPKCGVGANTSKPEIIWLDSLGIPESLRGKRIKIDGRLIKPDAYNPDTKTLYEFYGDYWHGNPKRFNYDETNLSVNKTFGELYNATIEREQLIKQAGYNLISIWENRGIKE